MTLDIGAVQTCELGQGFDPNCECLHGQIQKAMPAAAMAYKITRALIIKIVALP